MAIIFNPNKKIFTLQTAHTTYQMQVDRLGYLLHLYYGAKSTCDMTEAFQAILTQRA